ncbi:MAG: formylmethanofuran dehydrogenase subunit B [Candidatus Odinarchaeota archaeon]
MTTKDTDAILATPRTRITKHVICPFCGCLCDDIEVAVTMTGPLPRVPEGTIVEALNACRIGHTKFLKVRDEYRIYKPELRSGSDKSEVKQVSLEEAVQAAAKILANAKRPVIYGLASTSNEANVKALELAEVSGAIIDNTSSVCHGPGIEAVQRVGIGTCTLGKIKNYSDLIIYWGCNPIAAHPRHTRRYSQFIEGLFRQVEDRKIYHIDVRPTRFSDQVTNFIQIEPNKDYELMQAVRSLLRGNELQASEVAGVPMRQVRELTADLKNAQFDTIFFGLGLTQSHGKDHNIAVAIDLTADLNHYTKAVIMPLRGHFNVTGSNHVSTWTYGYPFSVSLEQGAPYYMPGETSAVDVLARGEADAFFAIAADPAASFPAAAVKQMLNIPVIALDPKRCATTEIADVVLPSAYVGIEADGIQTAYRMDGIPLQLSKIVDAPAGIKSDDQILDMLVREVCKIKGIKRYRH